VKIDYLLLCDAARFYAAQHKAGELELKSFRFRRSLSTPIPSFHDASEVLRAKRFNTIEELVHALRAELIP